MKPALTNRYTNFDFPEYKFQEYPKAVTHNGKVHVVNDAEEELKLKTTVRDYLAEARERAAELKLDIPSDWKVEKIQALIKKTESDIEYAKIIDAENAPVKDSDASKTSIHNELTLAAAGKKLPGRPAKFKPDVITQA